MAAKPPRSAPARTAVLVVVCLALFMALLDSTAISLTLPAMRADLGADLTGLVWIADGYVLVFAALLLTSGSLGDRLGRAPMFLAGLATFTVGSAVCAYAPLLEVLVAGRVLQGLGAALVTPQTLAILSHTFPEPRERARAFGVWSGVSALALLLGPVLGGVLAAHWGWRSVFLVNLPVGAVALVLGARSLLGRDGTARPDGPLRRVVDLPGQLLAVLWLGTLTFAVVEGSRYGWGSPLIVGLLLVSLAALAALLAVERRSAHPMLHLELFSSATFSASTLVIGLVAFGMYASFFLVSLFLQQAQDYSAAEAGVRFLPAMSAVMVASPLAGLLAGRVGSRVPVVTGTLLMGGALLLLARVGTGDPYRGWWPLLVLFGAGIGLVIPPVNSALMGSVRADRAGLASATGETGQQIGALVGIAVLGALVTGGFRRVVADGAGATGLSRADSAELARRLFAEDGDATTTASPAVAALVDRALTAGVHAGLVAAGIAALVAAAVALLIREPRGAPAETAAGGPAPTPAAEPLPGR
ncbi:drug resistance transporter, EmrB/QacA subfamily [Micromonospora viridifaciens]|uniref:Drug resistance transporter, EmrB/QacA subfamily n=1 Tax=Micromonospora viridifaciens TaxID=1881 RepID=A0A1C4WUS7_MICVI|nr:MFS transporter [Micromonospora viridifaciens]SCF00046.1 drug resistance transporter, EmrB/QacA subfamily [Micromonospora viridifaciens]